MVILKVTHIDYGTIYFDCKNGYERQGLSKRYTNLGFKTTKLTDIKKPKKKHRWMNQ